MYIWICMWGSYCECWFLLSSRSSSSHRVEGDVSDTQTVEQPYASDHEVERESTFSNCTCTIPLFSLCPPFLSLPSLSSLLLSSSILSSLSSLYSSLPFFPFSIFSLLLTSPPPPLLRGSGEVEDAPVSVVMHMFAGETVVIALCRDLALKLWSCQVSRGEGKNYMYSV